jgi:hypothetical protein
MELQQQVVAGLQKEEEKTASLQAPTFAIGIASIAFIILCAFFVADRQNPPEAQPANAAVAEFASGRAMEHLKMIASKPHPVGTQEHSEVRGYILKVLADLGLNPEVQKSSVLSRQPDGSYIAASVQNVIGKVEGAASRQAILLACHYDSVQTGPGASDDGASVAAFLEVIRSLKTSSPLKNDALFLFTDGEEIGSLGAKAFMDEHPRAKDVAIVLNFEARGVSGPSIMFETSEGNDWLIKEFAKAASHPVANSLTYDLYKLLGNDTDLTVFKNGGLRGLNFAYIAEPAHYHTIRDSYNNIDERSLQQQGAYALALTRHFGNVSDWPAPTGNAVYFDLFSSVLVSYSERLVLPLMTLALIFFVGLVILGLRMKRLTMGGIAFGIVAFLLNVIGVIALTIGAWLLIHSVSSDPTGGDFAINLFAAGFLSLTIAVSGAMLIWSGKKTSTENLMAGTLFWWAVLMILVCFQAPGGSYLVTWPLLLALLAVGTVFISKQKMTSATSIIILTIPALAGVILIAPLIRLMVAGFGMEALWALMVLALFPLALHNAHLNFLISIKKWLLPAASGVLGVCLAGAGVLMSGVSNNNPKMDHIFYAQNANNGQAIWASVDDGPDEWTAQFFSSGVEITNLADHFAWGEGGLLKGNAPALPLAPPMIVVLEDSRRDGLRALRLRVTSPRKAPALSIYWKRELKLVALAVNGKRVVEENVDAMVGPERYRMFSYFGLPEEGIELSLETKSPDPIDLKIEEWSYGLPVIPGSSYANRPDYIIAAPFSYSDSTVITKSITF